MTFAAIYKNHAYADLIQEAETQGIEIGVERERERILKLLFQTEISVPKEGLTERDSKAMQHALFQFTLKLRGLIQGENATDFTGSTLPISQCCDCCKDPVCLGCENCSECQTIEEGNNVE